MSHAEKLVCPECGHRAADSSRLLRRRVRWKTAVGGGLILLVGAFAPWVYGYVHEGKWVQLLPGTTLINYYSHFDDGAHQDQSKLFRELWKRIEQKELSDSAIVNLLDRCAQGDSEAPPGTIEWENKYGLPLAMYWKSYPERPDLESVVSHLASRVAIDFKTNASVPEIPTGVRTWAVVHVVQYKRSKAQWRPALRTKAQLPDADDVVRSSEGSVYVPIPPLDRGKHEIGFDIDLGSIQDDGSFLPLEHYQVKQTVDALDPPRATWTEDPAIADLLKSKAVIKLEPLDDERGMWFGYRPGPIRSSPLLANVRLKLAIELIHAGKVVGRAFYLLGEDREVVLAAKDSAQDHAWSVRIHDEAWTPGDTMSSAGSSNEPYWRGEVEWPLNP